MENGTVFRRQEGVWSACLGSMARLRSSRADRPSAVYLRAAQAYMLISMPTGTSTIFGVFQAIRVSQVWYWRVSDARINVKPARA
jgi:hypothetical protein